MRNTKKVRRSAAPNLLIQFPLAELTLQLAVDPSKSRRSIPARADGRSQQKPTVDPSKSRRSIPAKTDGRSQQEPTVDPDSCFPSIFLLVCSTTATAKLTIYTRELRGSDRALAVWDLKIRSKDSFSMAPSKNDPFLSDPSC
jgi:hypothetical protein